MTSLLIFLLVLTVNTHLILGQICLGMMSRQCARPKNFPNGIPLRHENFQNWDQSITSCNLWTAIPRNAMDVVTLANWAAVNDYKLRPQGLMHSWSPLTVSKDTSCEDTILVKTTEKLTSIQMYRNGTNRNNSTLVKVETGATMEQLLTYLENAGFTLATHPEIGKVTVGGVLAIGGHGLGTAKPGSQSIPGHTHGSVSNLIESMEIVAYDRGKQSYTLQTFDRSNNDTLAFLIHVGHAFVTSVLLRVRPQYNVRCISSTEIKISELFAEPNGNTDMKTFANLHSVTNRVTAWWFPFMDEAWVLNCSDSPIKPPESRLATKPYNYQGLKSVFPKELRFIFTLLETGALWLTPILCFLEFKFIEINIHLTNSRDIWGPSKNLLLYVEPTAILQADMGYVVITKEANIQSVISKVMKQFISQVETCKKKGIHPMNGPIQIRVSNVDKVMNEELPPYLSMIQYRTEYPDFDVAVWFDFSTAPLTLFRNNFYEELETFLLKTFNDTFGMARPEWSKGWAYTDQGPFTNDNVLKNEIPRRMGTSWDSAMCTHKKYDVDGIFNNDFLHENFVEKGKCNFAF